MSQTPPDLLSLDEYRGGGTNILEFHKRAAAGARRKVMYDCMPV